ncbi:Predicted ATPase [Streptomyces sp. yr375]|nr:Predicted ATPase [Streptomyces sp. yr375]
MASVSAPSSLCDFCGDAIHSTNSGNRKTSSKYCSNACRQRAYRRRLKGDGMNTSDSAGLPERLSSFVGRTEELVELGRLLRTTRVLTLTGPAGVGKTRLAVELAALEHRGGRSEAVLVELGAVLRGEAARQRIAAAAGGVGDPTASLTDPQAARLAAGGDLLLVLDNCEHVLDDCGLVLGELLSRQPGLRVLATSREPLRLPGETVYPVGGLGLPDPDADGSFTDSLRSDAVRLFVDRARAVAPEFQLTEDNAARIGTICARLDGLPLALELAARLVRALPLAEIHDRLDDRLSLLTNGWRTADPRHQSLRAALEWGYELLTPVEQSLFRALSVLPGGFGPDAAAAVAADDGIPTVTALELLAGLAAKSLITPCHDRAGSTRFRMLESVQCYGHERLLAEGEATRTYGRLVGWLTGLATPVQETAFAPLHTVRRMARERDNLTHALEWLSESDDERQLLLAGALAVVGIHRGTPADTLVLLSGALERTDPASRHRGNALGVAALLAGWRGDPEEAVHMARQGVALARQARQTHLLGRALLVLSIVKELHGDESAVEDLRECLELGRGLDDGLMTALCLNLLARQLLGQGDLEQAAELVGQALPVLMAEGTPALRRMVLHTTGILALTRGDLPTAEARFTECLDNTCHLDGAACSLEGLAVAAVRAGNFERGLRLFAAAETIGEPEPFVLTLLWRRGVEEARATALDALPRSKADAAIEAGREMEPRRAVEYALRVRREPAATAGGGGDPLSRREWDVIDLVAKGLTNRQIAARLYLSVRTVETHIRNIRTTLGLRSRAHVAAWAARRDRAVITSARPAGRRAVMA